MIAINQDPLGKGGNRIGYSDCPNVGLIHTKHDLIAYNHVCKMDHLSTDEVHIL